MPEQLFDECFVVFILVLGQQRDFVLRNFHIGQGTQHHDIGEIDIVGPKDRLLFDNVLQLLAVVDRISIKIFDQFLILFERTRRGSHILAVIITRRHRLIEMFDQFGIPHPPQFVRREVVGQPLAVTQCGYHAVIDEFCVRITLLFGRQVFLAAQFDLILGHRGDIDDQPKQLMVQLVSLVDAKHQVFIGRNQRIGIRFEVCVKRLHGLNAE